MARHFDGLLSERVGDRALVIAQLSLEADKVANAVNAAGEARRLPSVELLARGLSDFSRDCPSLLERTMLLDFDSGERLWPRMRQFDPMLFQLAPPNKAFGPRWWDRAAAAFALPTSHYGVYVGQW